jgi:hypothetical protein
MFPHERSLVKKYEGKAFVLIGVNGDGDSPELKKKNEKEQITWRSFKNDRSGKGPITDEWNNEGWPTLFLIDHKGVIRARWLGLPGDKALDKAIDKYVKEAGDAGK